MTRLHFRGILASLVVGAIITLSVAVGAALSVGRENWSLAGRQLEGAQAETAALALGVGADPDPHPDSPWLGHARRAFGYSLLEVYPTSLFVYPSGWTPPGMVSEIRVGWPWKALWCHEYGWRRGDTPQQTLPPFIVNGITYETSSPGSVLWGETRFYGIVPYGPLWIGLIANTLVFAAATVAVYLIARSLLRYRRLRRGRCWKCRHPQILSNHCPECGALIWPHRTQE